MLEDPRWKALSSFAAGRKGAGRTGKQIPFHFYPWCWREVSKRAVGSSPDCSIPGGGTKLSLQSLIPASPQASQTSIEEVSQLIFVLPNIIWESKAHRSQPLMLQGARSRRGNNEGGIPKHWVHDQQSVLGLPSFFQLCTRRNFWPNVTQKP